MTGDGSHAITWWSSDAAGNTEAAHTGYVNVWGTAPATSANAVVSAAADEGWRTSDPQPVSLTATGGHGAVTVHYVLDGGAQADAAGEATFDVAGDGSHELEYWATDELGNEETHHTGHVNIDTVAPVTTDDYAGGSAWQTGPVSFSLAADDATSGVDGTTWAVDGGAPQSGTDVTVTGDGEHTVTYSSTDLAGNAEDAAQRDRAHRRRRARDGRRRAGRLAERGHHRDADAGGHALRHDRRPRRHHLGARRRRDAGGHERARGGAVRPLRRRRPCDHLPVHGRRRQPRGGQDGDGAGRHARAHHARRPRRPALRRTPTR